MALANLSSILHVLISLLLINLSHSVPIITEAQLIPSGFSCTQDMPRQQGIYSTPSNSNLIKVDLIHVLCGQIYSSSTIDNSLKSSVRVGGFHARPGNTDPASASTANSQQTRTPPNVYGYAVYKYPYVYDVQRGTYVKKNTGSISSIWPTVLSMEEIVEIITELVYLCRYTLCERQLHTLCMCYRGRDSMSKVCRGGSMIDCSYIPLVY